MLTLTHASIDITPAQPGVTLSGFAARMNQPATGVDEPLTLHAVHLSGPDGALLLLVFDLLGFSGELDHAIRGDLAPLLAEASVRTQLQLACTHTHSAPTCQDLLGCGLPEPDYWQFLRHRIVEVARRALLPGPPVRLAVDTVELPELARNRRHLLANGRVVMVPGPDDTVAHTGPTFDRATLLRFVDSADQPVLGLLHWACHPVCCSAPRVSPDFPGELRRRLSERLGAPCVYLQGAAGNLNPVSFVGGREPMLAMAAQVADTVANAIAASPGDASLAQAATATAIPFGLVRPRHELAAYAAGMARMAATGHADDATLADLAGIVNQTPDQISDSPLMRHIAASMEQWAQLTLTRDPDRTGEALALRAVCLGPVILCFAGVEPFIETAIDLQRAFPDKTVLLVGYAGQVHGYLPTNEALDHGGYEAASAYRWYGRPAAFAPGSEQYVLHYLIHLATDIST